jgi:hypothetical protein
MMGHLVSQEKSAEPWWRRLKCWELCKVPFLIEGTKSPFLFLLVFKVVIALTWFAVLMIGDFSLISKATVPTVIVLLWAAAAAAVETGEMKSRGSPVTAVAEASAAEWEQLLLAKDDAAAAEQGVVVVAAVAVAML